MIYVGIDWSDKFHTLCILDADGTKLDVFDIPHGQPGFEIAHARISRHASCPQDVAVAIETKDSLFVDFLGELGYTLYFLNPKQTSRFRDRHRMSQSKSDAFDAYVLADAVRADPHLFNALSPLDEQSLKLRVLTRTRENLIQRKVSIQNELTTALKRYFPVALQLFDGLDHPGSVEFLTQYPTYSQASTVSERRIASILKNTGFPERRANDRARLVREKLQEAQPIPAPSVSSAYPLAVKSLLRQLQGILREVETLENEIRDTYKDHPNKDLLESLPGVGTTLGPVLAAEIGADMSRFSSLRTLKAYAGTSPVTVKSGKHQAIQFRRACNRRVRHSLHLASQTAIRCCGWARELYDRLRATGKTHGRALRAVGDQLIEMLYVILTRRTPYDEAYHLHMQSLHGKTV